MTQHTRAPSSEVCAAIVAGYLRGQTMKQVAQQYATTPYHVQRALRLAKVKARRHTAYTRIELPRDLLQSLTDQCLTVQEIADAVKASKPVVERALRHYGIRSQKGRGSKLERNYFWKGGRRIDKSGYVELKRNDHPCANAAGYVREHRLVMEQLLGRYLRPEEVVHHKDGNRQNNHPDNLQLFSSNGLHLRHERTGKVPNWTPQGRQRLRAAAQQRRRPCRSSASRRASKIGDSK